MGIKVLTYKSVRKMAGDTIFLRGEEYYRAGLVRSVAWDGPLASADVQGSRQRPYKVTITFRRGIPVVRCTCPSEWGGLCKHGVAVLLYLIDHGETGISEEEEADEEEGAPVLADSARKNFLISEYDAPRLELGLTLKGLQSSMGKGIPLIMTVDYQGRRQKLVDINRFLTAFRNEAKDSFPPVSAFSQGQLHLLHMINGFIGPVQNNKPVAWRLLPFQVSILLDHISLGANIDIVEVKGRRQFTLVQEPSVGLSVSIRSIQKNKIGVTASLSDPVHSGHRWQINDIFPGSRLWLLNRDSLEFRALHQGIDYRFLTHFLNNEQVLEKEERQFFLVGILPKLKPFAAVIVDDIKAHEFRVENALLKPRYKVDVERGSLTVAVFFVYGQGELGYAGRGQELFLERTIEGAQVLLRRDISREDALVQSLIQQCKCAFDGRYGLFFISSPDDIFDFLSEHVQRLMEEGEVFLSDKAKLLFQEGEEIRPFVRVSGSGIDWFAYDIRFSKGGQSVDIPEKIIRDHLVSGKKFLQLKTGEFVKINAEAFDHVARLLDDRECKGKLMLAHIPFVMDELRAAGVTIEADLETQSLYEELKGFKEIETVQLPASLASILRDYQSYGVSWLAFLKKFRFGGILADEMGLGKTIQALAMIQRDIEAGCRLPSLVVCPTTLVWNWEAEVRKFLPELKPLVISGKERRTRIAEISGASVVITSYALLRRDIDQYQPRQFHYLILDEAQNIKNRHTISARVTKQLNASHRLALTGTPLENSIADIWSIFDFLMPAFLGNYERFRTIYEMPITQDQDHEKLGELSRRIAPFVLRRIKRDVIKELPDKIEQTSFCELEPAQAKIYSAMADKARAQVVEAYRTKGFERSRMFILTLILRLRQICCHPELAGVRLKHRIGVSAKTDLLKEMLQEAVSSGHRVLIFSQFVEMLGILRDHLMREKIPFEYMDGRTKDRQKPVERFNTDASVKVFLLSLKVGGLGLNLTSADTVILYEPWWNPAVEQQAIDRAHRIGQNKAVLAYHLIARGTIEEKILELQGRKKFLMNALVLSEDSMSKKLGWDDIKFLLDLKE